MTIPINPVTLVAVIGFLASFLSGILRQDRLPQREYINAGITALFMLAAAAASLFIAGHALSWSDILVEVIVIMKGPGAVLESFLQVRINTGIPLVDRGIASLESQLPGALKATNAVLPQTKQPQPIVFPAKPGNPTTPDHAG